MCLDQVFAIGAFPLEKVGHGVEPETVEAYVEPVANHVEHGISYFRVVVIEVGLVGEEAVPVVLATLRVPRPIGFFGIDKDYACLAIALVVITPDVPISFGVGAILARLTEPGVLVACVVHDHVRDNPYPPPVRLVDQLRHVCDLAVLGEHRPVIGNVIAAVA